MSTAEVADDVMEHLVVLSETDGSKVLDSAVDGDSETSSRITIEVTVSAADLGEAVNIAVWRNEDRDPRHRRGDDGLDHPCGAAGDGRHDRPQHERQRAAIDRALGEVDPEAKVSSGRRDEPIAG